MSRPRKCRRVCYFPQTIAFIPVCDHEDKAAVKLTVDEYETIRLVDKEGLSQEQCGEYMSVARTTAQLIYASARKKLADALVEGRPIQIEGGDYRLCSGAGRFYSCGGCYKYQISRRYKKSKGETVMRIAVTYDNGQIFQHFGRTEQFKVYDVEEGKIISSEVVDANGSGHGALAGVLKALKVDTLICGGIGGGARAALNANGIKLYGAVSGSADAAIDAFLAGELACDPDARCGHHGHGHHGCGHHGHEHDHCHGGHGHHECH